MKKTLVLIFSLALAGCTTNGQPDYGKTALLLIGVIAVGAALSQSNEDANGGSNCYWSVTPTGSTQVCR